MWRRVATGLVWAGVGGSALFWGLRLTDQPLPVPPQTAYVESGAALRGELQRLLGPDPAPAPDDVPTAAAPVPDARFQLLGVVSPKGSGASAAQGLALIVVDDKPARTFRVGAVVDGDRVLQSVHARGATIGPRGGPAQVALEMPPPAPAATGSLPTVRVAPFGTAAAPPPPPVVNLNPVVPLRRPARLNPNGPASTDTAETD